MQQNGALLVVRNISSSACKLSPLADLAFVASDHGALKVNVEMDGPLHGPLVDGKRMPVGNGPVLQSLPLAGGAEATATLHWVSGPVFTTNTCVDVSTLIFRVGGQQTEAKLGANICAPDANHLTMKLSRLALDPVWKPIKARTQL